MVSNDVFTEELESLTAIFDTQLEIGSDGHSVTLTVKPCDDEADCFVRTDLSVSVPDEYPSDKAKVYLSNLRGIPQSIVAALEDVVTSTVSECAEMGEEVVFALVSAVQEFLLEHNAPSGECSICLEDGATELVKTQCYHFFHADCLARHVHFFRHEPIMDVDLETFQGARRQTRTDEEAEALLLEQRKSAPVPCPVCRSRLDDAVVVSLPPTENLPLYSQLDSALVVATATKYIGRSTRQQQEYRRTVFQHQQQIGGVIVSSS
eukprot:m.40853 g.40853  ORF g.40853 m.40853 type:complete len:264 (-) comp10476_c0_seq3:173-964(-)